MSNPSGVKRVFDTVSRAYDARIVQRLAYRPAQDLVVREIRDSGARRILDLGCGTGILASRLADEHDLEVVCGCDLSDGMLEKAVNRSRRPHWIQGDAGRLPFRARTFDHAVCTEAFHFFDQPAALAELHRVLRPGGVVSIALINPRSEVGSRMMGTLQRVFGAGSWPSRRRMRRMVEGAGFEVRAQQLVDRPLKMVLPTMLTTAVRPPVS